MTTLARLADALSRRWWATALLAVAIVWMMRRLLDLSAKLKVVTGYDAFDIQSDLGIEDMAAQLAHYTPEAVRLYSTFSSTDFLFPFASALFWAALLAWGLRRARPQLYAAGTWQRHLPWLFIGCAFDWVENVANAWVVGRYPPMHTGVASLALIAKYAKVTAVSAAAVLALAFVLWGAATSIAGFMRRKAG
ncbi:MAG: hypothetical protein AB7P31_12830 [Steroidobacteraceae bacterium]